jgi:hypothetical protein
MTTAQRAAVVGAFCEHVADLCGGAMEEKKAAPEADAKLAAVSPLDLLANVVVAGDAPKAVPIPVVGACAPLRRPFDTVEEDDIQWGDSEIVHVEIEGSRALAAPASCRDRVAMDLSDV